MQFPRELPLLGTRDTMSFHEYAIFPNVFQRLSSGALRDVENCQRLSTSFKQLEELKVGVFFGICLKDVERCWQFSTSLSAPLERR